MRGISIRCPSLAELPPPPDGRSGWPWTEESRRVEDTMSGGASWPRISVVTPSYNQGQFIEETIRSVLLQGYPDLEYIIIDGGSSDETVDIIREYEPWIARWVSEPDRGQGHALNKGIRRSSGDMVLWLNSDDLCLPGSFLLAATTFHANPGVKLVTGQTRLIDEKGQVIGELHSHFSGWEDVVTSPHNPVRQISTYFARTLFDELGPIDESLHVAMDNDLIVRFTRSYPPFVVNEHLTAFRVQPDAKTQRLLIKAYVETDRTRGRYLPDSRLTSVYRKRSSANWLNFSRQASSGLRERTACLVRAVRNRPLAICSRVFWSCLRKLAADAFPTTRPDAEKEPGA